MQKWEDRCPAPKLRLPVLGSGDRKRQKEALLAKAQKYFSYDYGTGCGTYFQVGNFGEVSENEEDYVVFKKDQVGGTCNTNM